MTKTSYSYISTASMPQQAINGAIEEVIQPLNDVDGFMTLRGMLFGPTIDARGPGIIPTHWESIPGNGGLSGIRSNRNTHGWHGLNTGLNGVGGGMAGLGDYGSVDLTSTLSSLDSTMTAQNAAAMPAIVQQETATQTSIDASINAAATQQANSDAAALNAQINKTPYIAALNAYDNGTAPAPSDINPVTNTFTVGGQTVSNNAPGAAGSIGGLNSLLQNISAAVTGAAQGQSALTSGSSMLLIGGAVLLLLLASGKSVGSGISRAPRAPRKRKAKSKAPQIPGF